MNIFPVQTIKTDNGFKKVPAIPKGSNWQTYEMDWKKLKEYKNYGVTIPNGFVIIDIDTHKGANKQMIEAALGCSVNWKLLQTTISGGEHYAFRIPEGVEIRQGSDLLGLKGFDTRCDRNRGWICTGEGYNSGELSIEDLLDVEEWPELPIEAVKKLSSRSVEASADDDLMSLVLAQKIEGYGEKECRFVVSSLPVSDKDNYDEWLRVGMALHHQSEGKKWGLKIWLDWSKKSEKFAGIEDLKHRWVGFGKNQRDSITFATLIKRAKEFGESELLKKEPVKLSGFVRCADFAIAEPPEWLIKGVLSKGEVNCIYGPSGSGKTFLALDMCLSVAQGEAWRNHRTKKRKVAYIAAEGARGVSMRLQAYASRRELDLNSVDLFVSASCPSLVDDASVEALLENVRALGDVDMLVVDTLAQCSAGADENNGKEMGIALRACRRVYEEIGASVLLIHHSGKDETRGARGWSGLRAALDTEICVSEKDGVKVAKVTKQKDGEMGAEYYFKLEQVVLGIDEDGDEITSCVVVEAERVIPDVVFKSKYQSEVFEYLKMNLAIDGDTERLNIDDIVLDLIDEFDIPESGKDTRKRNILNAIESVCSNEKTIYANEDGWVFFD